jgi:hypothetical protein
VQLGTFETALTRSPSIFTRVSKEVEEWGDTGRPQLVTKEYSVHLFVDRDYYLQALVDDADTIVAFSVTARRRRFSPRFTSWPRPRWRERLKWRLWASDERYWPLFVVRLGRTRFNRAVRERAFLPQVKTWLGARAYAYSEAYYFGNPGLYLTYVFTASSAVDPAPFGDLPEVVDEIAAGSWPDHFLEVHDMVDVPEIEPDETALAAGEVPPDPAGPAFAGLEALQRFRRATSITTVSVLQMSAEDYPTTFGPHGDEVRMLPT